MDDFKGTAALDAGLISSAQAVEHYEIARYGTLKAWAEKLGHANAVTLLDATLKEESKTDDALSALAKTSINAAAQKRRPDRLSNCTSKTGMVIHSGFLFD